MQTLIEVPTLGDLPTANEIISQANNFLILKSEEDQQKARELAKLCVEAQSEIEKRYEASKTAAFKAHREICKLEKKAKDPFYNAEKICRKALADYAALQEKIAEAEREKAFKKALIESDNAKLQAAVQAEENGDDQLAEVFLNQPPITENVVGKSSVNPMRWEAEVVDKEMFLRALIAVEDHIFSLLAEAIEFKKSELNKFAKIHQKEIQFPGLVIREIPVIRI